MPSLKNIVKKVVGKYNLRKITFSKKVYNNMKYYNAKNSFLKTICKTMVIKQAKNKGEQIKQLFSKVNLESLKEEEKFYYSIDFLKHLYNENSIIANFSIDYSDILNNSLNDYKSKINKYKENAIKRDIKDKIIFYDSEIQTIEAIEILIDRIVEKVTLEKGAKNIIRNLKNIKIDKATNFEDALQRILFFNQLLWQTGHFLNGLGRLDMVLQPYYENELKGKTNKKQIKGLLKEFIRILHKYYNFKSNSLMGDTGQVIILGGMNANGEYEYNDLTYLFIEVIEELQLPDPKVLLRVSKNMPRDLMEKSLKCIKTGIGCPLFANDDVIVPKLIDFGIEEKDAYNYGTSACWEPHIIGKSISQNNIATINYVKPLNNLLDKENLEKIVSIDDLLEIYKKYLSVEIETIKKHLDTIVWETDSLLSLFIQDSIKNGKDIANGGAKYSNYGLLTVGLANTIDSIFNIEKIVYQEKKMSLKELNEYRKNNFNNSIEFVKELKNNTEKYGKDTEKAIYLSNEIFNFTSECTKNYKNLFNGGLKIGLSSPAYIDEGSISSASLDGRKQGEPFSVHISADMSDAYTELMQFASKLDYNENRFNGNVVDFFVSPNFIEDNFDKFVDFLMLSIKAGFFEIQMNVVSSKTLIEARKNPEKFPNLIVRVWGFSSYFKDLPDEYKDYIIERALRSEGNSY